MKKCSDRRTRPSSVSSATFCGLSMGASGQRTPRQPSGFRVRAASAQTGSSVTATARSSARSSVGAPAERGLEPGLRRGPVLRGGAQAGLARVGQLQLLAAPIGVVRRDRDQAIALERPEVAAERRAVHHELGGERVDRHRPEMAELGQHRELGGTQPARRQMPVVELGHVPRGLAHRQTGADLGGQIGRVLHRRLPIS